MIYYKVKFLPGTFPNAYHVINTKTNITQSMWSTMQDAMTAMRDLNAFERRQAKAANVVQVRCEVIPLRGVSRG